MTIFDEVLDGKSVEQIARAEKARELLEDLFNQVGVSPSEEIVVPVRNFWDIQAHLPPDAARVWTNRDLLGKSNPTYRLVETQLGVDGLNSYVAHAEVDKGKSSTIVPGGDLLLFGPALAYVVVALVLGIGTGEFLIPLIIAVVGGISGLFIGSRLMDGKISRKKNDPIRDWYAPGEFEVAISKPVSFAGESDELRLIRIVSLLRGSMAEMRAWNEDVLSIARAGFDLDYETLNIIAQAAAIVEHGAWLAEYSEVQEIRGARDESEIERKIEENNEAFSDLVDRVSELVSLYYSVFALDLRMRAEDKLLSLSQDEREHGLIPSHASGSLELGEKVDLTHDAYRESLELANSRIASFIANG